MSAALDTIRGINRAATIPADINALIRSGYRIQAIKRYRQITGKNFVDARKQIYDWDAAIFKHIPPYAAE